MATTELLFKAFADTTRQRILRALSAEELSVTELVEVLDQPQSTVSRHLKVLRDAGLLVDRRSRSTVLHSVLPPLPDESAALPGAGAANGGGPSGGGSSGSVNNPQAHRCKASGQEAIARDGNGRGAAGEVFDGGATNGGATNGGVPNGNGGAAGLRTRLLQWVREQGLDADLRERLERVLRSRRAQTGSFFDAMGGKWDHLRIEAFGEVFHLEALTWLLPSTWTVADVGTGTGYLLPLLCSRFAGVVAVDASAAMLETARQRPDIQSASNITFRLGSLDRLPIEDASVDLAIASLVLHHVVEPTRALAELRRCIRPGGVLLMIEQEPHRHIEFHERMGDRWWGFDPSALMEWTRQAGFGQTDIRPLPSARPTTRRSMETPRLYAVIGR